MVASKYRSIYTASIMLHRSALRASCGFAPRLASTHSRFASSLVLLEHRAGKLNDASLSAVTAAKALDNDVSYNTMVSRL